MAERLDDPRRAFPKEVVKMHDEQGIPWPSWFAGTLYTDRVRLREALRGLDRARKTDA